jgi:hypothetical protein
MYQPEVGGEKDSRDKLPGTAQQQRRDRGADRRQAVLGHEMVDELQRPSTDARKVHDTRGRQRGERQPKQPVRPPASSVILPRPPG